MKEISIVKGIDRIVLGWVVLKEDGTSIVELSPECELEIEEERITNASIQIKNMEQEKDTKEKTMDIKFKDVPVYSCKKNKHKLIGKMHSNKNGQCCIEFLEGHEIDYSDVKNDIGINFEVTKYVKNKQNLFSSVKSLKVKEITFIMKG